MATFVFLKQVIPAAGIIRPDHIAEVSVHLEDFPTVEEFVDGVPRNAWCEDTRDQEVLLVVNVSFIYNTTDTRNHRIRVRHCRSSRTARTESKPNASRQVHGHLLHRADYQHLSGSYDVVDHLRSLHSP